MENEEKFKQSLMKQVDSYLKITIISVDDYSKLIGENGYNYEKDNYYNDEEKMNKKIKLRSLGLSTQICIKKI